MRPFSRTFGTERAPSHIPAKLCAEITCARGIIKEHPIECWSKLSGVFTLREIGGGLTGRRARRHRYLVNPKAIH